MRDSEYSPCLTARISESLKQESGCILSDILISDVPEKYYLNQKQMEQLLFKSGQEVREKESTSHQTCPIQPPKPSTAQLNGGIVRQPSHGITPIKPFAARQSYGRA